MGKITKKSVNEVLNMYNGSIESIVLTLVDPRDKNRTVLEIPIKNELTISEKGAFVDRVVNACFDANGNYIPEYLNPTFEITLLQMTTDIPVFEESEDIIDIEKTYQLCKAVNLIDNVHDIRYKNLVHELKNMVEDKLAYVKNVNTRKVSDSLAELINVLKSFQDMTSESSLTETINRMENTCEKIIALRNDFDFSARN